MGRGTDPQWRMMMELVEESGERERERDREICELKEALKYRRENQTERNEAERSSQMNESPMYREKKSEEAPYREDNEREREYREVVQHQQSTIEMLLKEMGRRNEQVNEDPNRNTEVSVTKNERVETISEAISPNSETHQLPNEIASLEGLKGGPSAGHNLLPETLRGTLQQVVQLLQQLDPQSTCNGLCKSMGDLRSPEISPAEGHEMEITPIKPGWVTGMTERVEALNQQLSVEREKARNAREVSRQQETALEEAIKRVQEQLKRAEGGVREPGTGSLIWEREIDTAVGRISRMLEEASPRSVLAGQTKIINGDLTLNEAQAPYRRESDLKRVSDINMSNGGVLDPINISGKESTFHQGYLNGCNGERVPRRRRHSVGRSETQCDRDRTESESEGSQGTASHRKRRKTTCRGRGADRNDPEPREREIRVLPQKIPLVLCEKFGDAPTRDFKTFEREFREMCDLYSIPDSQKLTRFKLHLEGNVL
ncbi:MAG: hypothetical protein GY820_21655, partial [Gammaproteobacteria bacterium]|nr:hypothetical protein [Gammaproteobacteria bacterium]